MLTTRSKLSSASSFRSEASPSWKRQVGQAEGLGPRVAGRRRGCWRCRRRARSRRAGCRHGGRAVAAAEVEHVQPGRDPERRDERLAALAHGRRDAGEVALLPQRLVRVRHRGDSFRFQWGRPDRRPGRRTTGPRLPVRVSLRPPAGRRRAPTERLPRAGRQQARPCRPAPCRSGHFHPGNRPPPARLGAPDSERIVDLARCNLGLGGQAEIRPRHDLGRPARFPPLVEIETEGALGVVRLPLCERRRPHARAVGERDDRHRLSLRPHLLYLADCSSQAAMIASSTTSRFLLRDRQRSSCAS